MISNKARNHMYLNKKEYYDTTHYDQNLKYLDVGFQNLKKFTLRSNLYGSITSLFISHNYITLLPEPSLLPHLTHLNCSYNPLLTAIPHYQNLLELFCNHCPKLTHVNTQTLKILDCSSTLIDISFKAPYLKELYCRNCKCESIDGANFKNLEILDAESCNLVSLSRLNVLEICVANNNLSEIPIIASAVRVNINNNNIKNLSSFPNAEIIEANHNKLTEVSNLLKLKKLSVRSNKIKIINNLPIIEIIDATYNQLTTITKITTLRELYVIENPSLVIKENIFGSIFTCDMDYKAFIASNLRFITHHFRIEINKLTLMNLLNKYNERIDPKLLNVVSDTFNKNDFRKHPEMIKQLTDYLYNAIYGKKKSMKNYNLLLMLLQRIYYRSLIIIIASQKKLNF